MHSNQPGCSAAFAAATKLIGDKWSLQLIHLLSTRGQGRFNELLEGADGICPRTLSARLTQLEAHAVIQRHVEPASPPRVSYRLTAKGQALLPVIDALQQWSRHHVA